MKTFCMSIALTVVVGCMFTSAKATEPGETSATVAVPVPHCEVPCGIYADQRRFEEMLEDQHTIEKAISSINDMLTEMQDGPPTATSLNQSVRWVNAKESHATNVQHIVAQYFLTQRIKPDHKDYSKQLVAAHTVMVSAMKCKQDSNPETAVALKKAILDLYRAYEGKEPNLDHDHDAPKHDAGSNKR